MWFAGEGREVDVHTLKWELIQFLNIFFVISPLVFKKIYIILQIAHISGPGQRQVYFSSAT